METILKYLPPASRPVIVGALVSAAVAGFIAHSILDPHVARASERVKVMCLWARMADDYAEVQTANINAICERVAGEACLGMPARPGNPLLEGCEEGYDGLP